MAFMHVQLQLSHYLSFSLLVLNVCSQLLDFDSPLFVSHIKEQIIQKVLILSKLSSPQSYNLHGRFVGFVVSFQFLQIFDDKGTIEVYDFKMLAYLNGIRKLQVAMEDAQSLELDDSLGDTDYPFNDPLTANVPKIFLLTIV